MAQLQGFRFWNARNHLVMHIVVRKVLCRCPTQYNELTCFSLQRFLHHNVWSLTHLRKLQPRAAWRLALTTSSSLHVTLFQGTLCYSRLWPNTMLSLHLPQKVSEASPQVPQQPWTAVPSMEHKHLSENVSCRSV